ncbi:MAG: GNAT family N-acetyltransferase [Nanoarchaeota archaeon]|nr:GNAT family N-acetyltransferase [Nanoarchaeota archaeon]MBU1004589.1 GNAT family N-acetyltransferase [Nanoarchaeota archaeon]MBU1946985.1 GNAT family N-acetyltransferase [Nanoarchaeota archaeon]
MLEGILQIKHSNVLGDGQIDRVAEFLVRAGIAISSIYLDDVAHAVEVGRAYINQVTRRQPYQCGFFAAFFGDYPVGFVSYLIVPVQVRHTLGYEAALGGDLHVALEHRREGIGTRLIAGVEDYFRQLGIHRYVFLVAPGESAKLFWRNILSSRPCSATWTAPLMNL